MAKTIDTVSHHVDATTAAVVTFKSAVIAAEKQGADHVCENVNRGFFTLMHSQISQKIAANQSRADSLLIQLNAQKKRLLAIKSTMETDYRRIVSRYHRIITGINKALRQRVVELDRPVFDFANRDISCNMSRNLLLSATIPVCQLENISACQQIVASNMKRDTVRVIGSTERFLRQMNEQKILTEKMLLHNQPGKEGTKHIPIAVLESQIDQNGHLTYDVSVPEGMDETRARQVSSNIIENSEALQWKDTPLDEQVKKEFARMIAESNSSERVKKMASQLFDNWKIQTL